MAEKSEQNAVPVTWPELLEESRPVALYGLEYLRKQSARLSEKTADTVAVKLGAYANTLSMSAVVLGPAECLPCFPPLDMPLRRALSEVEGGLTKGQSVAAIGLLDYLNAARCCGTETPPEAVGVEPSWLAQLAQRTHDLTEEESKTLAFAALAAALPDLAVVFIGGGPLTAAFHPGKTFRFNVQGFVRYIAAGIREEAGPEAVEAAWRDFVDCFPRKLASKTLRWPDLLWAARTMMEHFEGRPAATVASNLHEFVV